MISTTILGSILGFAGSALAPIVGYFEKKNSAKHEIAKLGKAAEMIQAGFEQDQVMYALTARSDEHKRLLDHDIAISKGTGFTSGLAKMVRPILTYSFFALFAVVEMSTLNHALSAGTEFNTAILQVWDQDTQAIFATIITFWFGNRVFEKRNKLP
jgi:hypothetical protein|tara:strand:+ start:1498 stop:1965 length:468 start_codon:yes stop_codon:yes gene_type:complete